MAPKIFSQRYKPCIKIVRRNASNIDQKYLPLFPSPPTRVSLTKSAFKKNQVKFLPSFVSARASKDRNFEDDI